MPPDTELDNPTVTRGRQRPGAACDECRRRKLRCDGQHPQCGVCRDTNMVCEVTQRGVRGPKKGHLKALKNRIVHLEAMLETRSSPHQHQPHLRSDLQGDSQNGHDDDGRTTGSSGSEHEAFVSNGYGLQESNLTAVPSNQDSFASVAPASNPSLHLSEMIQAELYATPLPSGNPFPVVNKCNSANLSLYPPETSCTWTVCTNQFRFSTKGGTCHGLSLAPRRRVINAYNMLCGPWPQCCPLIRGT